MNCISEQKFKSSWFTLEDGKTASVAEGAGEVLGISILGGEGRRPDVEAWGPYSPELCKRDAHDGFSGRLPSDFCLMNAISQADSHLALKRNAL